VVPKSTLGGFERAFPKVHARNQNTVDALLKQRTVYINDEVIRATSPTVTRMLDLQREHTRAIRNLEDTAAQVESTLRAKWVDRTVSGPRGTRRLQESDIPKLGVRYGHVGQAHGSALGELRGALSYLEGGVPWFAGGRGKRWEQDNKCVSESLQRAADDIATHRRNLSEELEREALRLFGQFQSLALPGAVLRADTALAKKGTAALSLNQVQGAVGEGIPYPLAKLPKGHARLLMQCGWTAHGSSIWFTGPAIPHAGAPPEATQVGTEFLYVPLILDLVAEHGFATPDEQTVKSFLLRALNTLPAGSVTLSVYDPAGMGDFVSYLYPLGDKQELVLGRDGVLSTFRQLQDLLEDVERHIAVINQKYLSGKYDDLIAYNQDAGVTFEPYRFLIINDDPGSWEKKYRQELTDQLRRIVAAGPKCGVFVIVRAMAPGLGLPLLSPGEPPQTKFSVTAKNTQTSHMPISSNDVLLAGSARGFYGIHESVTWVPPNASWLDDRGVAEIVHNLERELQNARSVEVSPKGVAAISRLHWDAQAAKGVKFGPPPLEPDDPTGWWKESSIDGLSAYVGVDKANQKKPRLIRFRGSPSEFGAIVGGQSRSGKTTFLHTLISELIRRYSPDELELYLVDVKFGAEFKAYARARVPHARVIALESGAEFAVSVLAHLVQEMERRYNLFKSVGVAKIDDYKRTTKKVMPRVLAVVDEFSGMFEDDNVNSAAASQSITRLIQQGSAAGIHLVLATQSLSTAVALPKNVLAQIPQRVVFKVPDQDSRMFLADDNPRAAAFDRPGEGVYNGGNGRKDANEEFQGTFTKTEKKTDDLGVTLAQVARLAKNRGYTRSPIVLESPGATPWSLDAIAAAKQSVSGLRIATPIGLPLSLGPSVVVKLEQTANANCLACVHGPQSHLNVASSFVFSGIIGKANVLIIDFAETQSEFDSGFAHVAQHLTAKSPNRFRYLRGKSGYGAIDKLRAQCDAALQAGKSLITPWLVVVVGLPFAAEWNQISHHHEAIMDLLARGPAAGIHLAVIADSLGTVKSRLGLYFNDSFSVFLAGPCGVADSHELVQSDAAARLDSDEQVVLYDRITGSSQKVRPFRIETMPLR
jgi:hypothetical protein